MSNTHHMGYKRVLGATRSSCSNGFRGFRLNIRKLSVQRLRVRFIYLFRVFNKWKKTYERAVRSLKRAGMSSSRKSSTSCHYSQSTSRLIGRDIKSDCRLKSLGRTNSFYTEAIADCLEFIKRNSVSIDDPHDEAAPIAAAMIR